MAISPEPASVSATLNYFTPPADGAAPYTIVNTGERNWASAPRTMHVENLRGREDTVALDTAGFQYGVHAPAHTAFERDADIEREYYPESAALIRHVTGARRVVLFDHTIRRRRPGEKDDAPDRRQPVPSVHVDQSDASARARVLRHLPASDAPALLAGRFQILNLWRPIGARAWDHPLALCDARSVRAADFVPSRIVFGEREGETLGVLWDAGHAWKYVRGMRPEEYVLIKCYDSKPDVAKCTPHTAFADPTTPEDAPLRQSIELRALVFYD